MQFKTYTKQKLSIQAFQYTGINGDLPEHFRSIPQAIVDSNGLSIQTLEGVMSVNVGDWVIRGIKGEYYPCKPDIFDKSYEVTQEALDYLPPHMQRVYVELQELEVKIIALAKYLSKGCPKASSKEAYLLKYQLEQMNSYASSLVLRLRLYAPSQETKISLIYAKSTNHVIGKENALPWNIPEEMAQFKDLTIGKTVIMGSKTYESMGCKALDFRTNIVLTSDRSKYDKTDVIFLSSLEEAIDLCKLYWEDNVFIIGGAGLLKEGLKLATTVYESIVDRDIPVDENTTVLDFNMADQELFESKNIPVQFNWGMTRTYVRK